MDALDRIQDSHNDLRAVIEPQGAQTVTNAPADQHGGFSFGESTSVVFREIPLVRGHQAADYGQGTAPCLKKMRAVLYADGWRMKR